MNGIQEIGLSYSVAAADAYDAFRKFKILLEIILELVE
jgi:hypothetical protein